MSQLLNAPANADSLTQGLLIRRFCALMIDFLLIGIVSTAAALFIAVFGIITLGLGWFAFHIVPLLPLLYFTALVGTRGATPGQRAMGLAVRQDASFAPPTIAQALVWSLLLWVSFFFACVPFALALVGPRHRAGHDLLSGLVLVRSP
ncbi:MAG: RDD family protein [Acidocella sp.]|nr:RDD family protein [Acidocella sp.]